MSIPCKIVKPNKKSEDPHHMWTVVKLQKKWYIVDPQEGAFLVGSDYYQGMLGMRWNTKKYPKVSKTSHKNAADFGSITD